MNKTAALRESCRKARRLTKPNILDNRVLVGTQHKTGTVWLRSIFSQIAREYALRFKYSPYRGGRQRPDDLDIFFHAHSHFALDDLPDDYRGLHMIRDPRDVVVSACFYHQKGRERGMHLPVFQGGRTYHEKINSYNTLDDQLLFEMEHYSAETIQRMMAWNYDHPAFYEVKYEDLITRDALFDDIFRFLGFRRIDAMRVIADRNHMRNLPNARTGHIRSGAGGQWRDYFTEHHKQRFRELFGDALIDLGYETSNDW